MPPLKPLLTADEAAEMLTEAGFPVSSETVRRWARKGRIAVVRSPGGAKGPKYFRREDIAALLISEKAGAA